jgi:hypothetical protein
MWGSIVGGIGSVVGGVLGLQSQKQSAANAEKLNQLNYEHQKEFAQNGIRWKVADAKAAGLHPLAALGASTAQYTPATAIGDSPDWSFLADAGQSIGRAVDAKRTQQERVEQQQKQDAAFALKAENQKAENDLIRAQTASIQQDMVLRQAKASEQAVRTQQQVPAMPSLGCDGSVIAGQGDATSPAGIEAKPAEIVVNDPQTRTAEAGSHPDKRWLRTSTGGYQPVRSEAAQNALEDDIVGSFRYDMRNGLANMANSQDNAPPRAFLPDGGRGNYFWFWDGVLGEWYPVKVGDILRNRPSWLPDKLRRFQGVK